MASNFIQKMVYNVDITFCIDCTESMDNILNIVKSRALAFYDDVQEIIAEKGKSIDKLRVRLVAFRDYRAYDAEKKRHATPNEPMMVTDFFTLPQEAPKLELCVSSLLPIGGGDDPEDGLEALAYAIRSDWNTDSTKCRHIIVLWTDAIPHELGFGKGSSRYPAGMAQSMEELTEWWGDLQNPGYMPKQPSKRLLLFAPNEGGWKFIANNWDNIMLLPSKAGDGLREFEYKEILGSIAQTLS